MKQLIWLLLLVGFTDPVGTAPPSRSPPSSQTESQLLPQFDYLQGWLGADDAYSIPLARGKSLWLFGDTFVGDPETCLAAMPKRWSAIASAFPLATRISHEQWSIFGGNAIVPNHVRFWTRERTVYSIGRLTDFCRGTLYVSLLAVRNKPGSGADDPFGFEIAGTKLATIHNVRKSPDRWRIAIQGLTDARLWPGVSLVSDGKYVIWYTQVTKSGGKGYMTVMRVPLDPIAKPPAHWQYEEG